MTVRANCAPHTRTVPHWIVAPFAVPTNCAWSGCRFGDPPEPDVRPAASFDFAPAGWPDVRIRDTRPCLRGCDPAAGWRPFWFVRSVWLYCPCIRHGTKKEREKKRKILMNKWKSALKYHNRVIFELPMFSKEGMEGRWRWWIKCEFGKMLNADLYLVRRMKGTVKGQDGGEKKRKEKVP